MENKIIDTTNYIYDTQSFTSNEEAVEYYNQIINNDQNIIELIKWRLLLFGGLSQADFDLVKQIQQEIEICKEKRNKYAGRLIYDGLNILNDIYKILH
ncbi:MAG: hypothetical protein EGR31_01845 [Clostridium sp.]|nr:hypothetical protein [Clostridium sp.]